MRVKHSLRDVTAPWYQLPAPCPEDAGHTGCAGAEADHRQERGPAGAEPVIVVGAGLAGAAVARALAERERKVIVLDAGNAIASGASGNPAGVVKPFVTRDASPTNAFYRFAHRALLDLLDRPEQAERCAFQRCGVLQLVNTPYPERPDYQRLDAAAASAQAGHRLSSPALWFAEGGWLDPARMCRTLLDHPLIDCRVNTRVAEVHSHDDESWTVCLAADHLPGEPSEAELQPPFRRPRDQLCCRQLVLATGTALTRTTFTRGLPLTPARGQLSQFALTPSCAPPTCVVSGRHYTLPAGRSIFVGATFERDDTGEEVRIVDHLSNQRGLQGLLPSVSVQADAIAGRAGVRATTPDRLPLLGPAPDIAGYQRAYAGLQHGQSAARFPAPPLHRGLYVFGGLGSRGINVAVGCGQLLASHLCGDSAALQAWSPLLHPGRFCIRALRRAG